jgi:large subunit ribosomal protein L5
MYESIKKKYTEKIIPKREEFFGAKNILACPNIEKVVLNARIKQGGNIDEEFVLNTLAKISGQKANPTKARKSISNFKIRQGMSVGAKVTLRGKRAIDFLDRLINVTLARTRDFNGLDKKGFDGHGNFTIGLNEHNVFPESAGDDVAHLHGIEITINTSAGNDKDGFTLLKELGFPFKK